MHARLWMLLALAVFSVGNADEVRTKTTLAQVFEPIHLYAPASNGGVLLTEPDGRTVRFFYRLDGKRVPSEPGIGGVHEGTSSMIYEDVSADGGLTWLRGKEAFDFGEGAHSDIASVNPHSGEIYWIYRQRGKSFLIRTSKQRSDWSNKIEVPFAVKYDSTSLLWLRNEERSGFHRLVALTRSGGDGTISYTSDDDGITWQGPSNLCTSPVHKDRWPDRGISPHAVELNDGRLWMLLRNGQDHLWEYYSTDRGASWSRGRPSRFVGVFSNVRLHRIPDGRLVILWLNNMPRSGIPRKGNPHKTSRDILHAAISDDDGKTWRGFREVVLGNKRHSMVYTTKRAYDASVHHQKITVTRDNKALVFTGQDDSTITFETEHRQAVMFDLEWLYETSHSTDFSHGYDDLCVFKLSTKPWRNTYDYSRVLGATLIEHPTKPFKKVLHLGREKCDWVFNEQDGASWNFPIGKQGSLETRILLRKGFKGGAITLGDVFYPPADNAGDSAGMYRLDIPENGRIGETTILKPDTWHDLKLEWTGVSEKSTHECRVYLNGTLLPRKLRLNNPSLNGICYVRFRSTSPEEDPAGWLIESIHVNVAWGE